MKFQFYENFNAIYGTEKSRRLIQKWARFFNKTIPMLSKHIKDPSKIEVLKCLETNGSSQPQRKFEGSCIFGFEKFKYFGWNISSAEMEDMIHHATHKREPLSPLDL